MKGGNEMVDQKDLEGLSIVTEQGMFGELDIEDPTVVETEPKDKKEK